MGYFLIRLETGADPIKVQEDLKNLAGVDHVEVVVRSSHRGTVVSMLEADLIVTNKELGRYAPTDLNYYIAQTPGVLETLLLEV